MNFEVCEKVRSKLQKENIRLEYSSLLNQTNQFMFRQENEDNAIIVPRKTILSEVEANWTLAHEYGHYLVRLDKKIDEFFVSRIEIEKLCWQKGKLFLEELGLSTKEGKDTYDGFAERNLGTYKTDINNYKCLNDKSEKAQLLLNIFSDLSNGIAAVMNGLIVAYILLTVVNLEGDFFTFLRIAILVNTVRLIIRYVQRK